MLIKFQGWYKTGNQGSQGEKTVREVRNESGKIEKSLFEPLKCTRWFSSTSGAYGGRPAAAVSTAAATLAIKTGKMVHFGSGRSQGKVSGNENGETVPTLSSLSNAVIRELTDRGRGTALLFLVRSVCC